MVGARLSSTGLATYGAMAYSGVSQSVRCYSLVFPRKGHVYPPVTIHEVVQTQHVEAASSPRRRTLGRRSVAAPAGEHAQHALRCGGSSS